MKSKIAITARPVIKFLYILAAIVGLRGTVGTNNF